MKIKGAIFDLDGTILDSMEVWDKALVTFLNNNGKVADESTNKDLESLSMTEGAEYLKEKYSLDMDISMIISDVNTVVKNLYSDYVKVKDGAEAFLKELKESDIKIVAATSSDRDVAEKALKKLGLIEYFEKIFTCTEEKTSKEKPEIFLKAAEYMGINPKETLVFEDALYALKTAKYAGFIIVGVYDKSSSDKQEEIKSISDFYLRSFGGEINEKSFNNCWK
jgi:HAD superfamily hydrolase (TIGR01509 family)